MEVVKKIYYTNSYISIICFKKQLKATVSFLFYLEKPIVLFLHLTISVIYFSGLFFSAVLRSPTPQSADNWRMWRDFWRSYRYRANARWLFLRKCDIPVLKINGMCTFWFVKFTAAVAMVWPPFYNVSDIDKLLPYTPTYLFHQLT